MLKSQELNDLYKNKKAALLAEKETIQHELDIKYSEVAKARQNFLAETDGSGGTGKVGIKDIAIAKRNEYQKLDGEYQQLSATDQPKTIAVEADLKTIDDNIKKEQAAFEQYFNNGFLTQIEALNNLIKNNTALQFRYYLLVIILLLIELMPVIAKTILPSGTYDERAMQREIMEKEMVSSNISKEKELKEMYNALAYQNDKEAITAFFDLTKEDRTQKIKTFSRQWKEENNQTFNGLWEKMKKEVLTRQEH